MVVMGILHLLHPLKVMMVEELLMVLPAMEHLEVVEAEALLLLVEMPRQAIQLELEELEKIM
jgi:hypothetical protein